jgi:poly(A) polymerase
MAHPFIEDLIALARVRTLAENADLSAVLFCEEFLRNTPREEIDPPALLTGADLIAHGFKPGPEFKPLLEAVRDAQLNGEIGTKEEALSLAERLRQAGKEDD